MYMCLSTRKRVYELVQKQENTLEQMVVLLEITPEDPQDADIAFVDAVRRDTIEALQKEGYRIQLSYTGQRGGVAPVEIFTTLTNAASYLVAHKDVIEETMNDISALITIFGGVIPIIKHVFKANDHRALKEQVLSQPIKIATIIEGVPIFVEANDLEQAEAALKLARRYQAQYPTVAAHVTTKSNVRVKGNIPKKQARRRR